MDDGYGDKKCFCLQKSLRRSPPVQLALITLFSILHTISNTTDGHTEQMSHTYHIRSHSILFVCCQDFKIQVNLLSHKTIFHKIRSKKKT